MSIQNRKQTILSLSAKIEQTAQLLRKQSHSFEKALFKRQVSKENKNHHSCSLLIQQMAHRIRKEISGEIKKNKVA